MKIRKILVICLLIASVILVSGCAQEGGTQIKSQEDVSKAVTNISTNIENVASTLDDIDKKLG